jgi:hypothetical protein
MPENDVGQTISHVQDALERWQARVRLWDIEDAGGWQQVCAHMDEPKPALHQPWATPA